MKRPTALTPPTITPRNVAFRGGTLQERWWLGRNPVATAFYNSMSVIFPQGEAFFIASVRAFRDEVPPALAAQIRGFIQQEVFHSREHLAFNRRLTDAGYDIRPLEKHIEDRITEIRTHSAIACLNSTVASEHLTGILAHELLVNPRHLARAPEEVRRMWEWHCMEEIEHKSVVYDTWLHVTRDWSPIRRWLARSHMMLIVTRNFLVDRRAGISELLRQDGQRTFGNWCRLAWYLMVDPGIMRGLTGPWLSYFMPRFHPWRHDNRHLIKTAEFDAQPDGDHRPAAV